jgi:hypothetical protein
MSTLTFHGKSEDMCRWVLKMYGNIPTNNTTTQQWLQDCRDRLKELGVKDE